MGNGFIFRVLVRFFLASAGAWMSLSAFEKGMQIAGMFAGEPGFPAEYVGFFALVGVIAGIIALAAVVISMSVSYRGAGLFRWETDSIRDDVEEIRDFVGMDGRGG